MLSWSFVIYFLGNFSGPSFNGSDVDEVKNLNNYHFLPFLLYLLEIIFFPLSNESPTSQTSGTHIKRRGDKVSPWQFEVWRKPVWQPFTNSLQGEGHKTDIRKALQENWPLFIQSSFTYKFFFILLLSLSSLFSFSGWIGFCCDNLSHGRLWIIRVPFFHSLF